MDIEKKNHLKKVLSEIGGETWVLLLDAYEDDKFKSILSDQERNHLNSITDNTNLIRSRTDLIKGILLKYISWKVYKETDLIKVNDQVKNILDSIDESKKQLETIRQTAKYIGDATVLVEYAKVFQKSSKEHMDNADSEKKKYMVSLIFMIVMIGSVFFLSISDLDIITKFADDLKLITMGTGFLIIKVMILFFVYQISIFYKRNYNAEKHLQEVYQHRSDVLNSLHAVYNGIKDSAEKDKILTMGVLFAYERGETGYITTKEGAGSNDSLVDGIFSKFFNR
ncbi:MAG TPA: hypothetical protein PKA60_01155 [Candidatus Paceibacterota bacterium]|nr:hypothetical protein [Candidatus Paceibacterota bacterium]